MQPYGRDNLSPRYRARLEMYREKLVARESAQDRPEGTGSTAKIRPEHAASIKTLIDETGATSLLDYGCGKGQHYLWRDLELPGGQRIESLESFWAIERVAKYDPGYEPFSKLPDGSYHGVICTNVLEHVPEEDIPWVLGEMFSFAERFVYANIACYPATRLLPSGEDAHATIRPPDWWGGLIHAVASRYPEVQYRFLLATRDGARKHFGLFGKHRLIHHTIDGGGEQGAC